MLLTLLDGAGPLYLRLSEALRLAIRDGRLRPGDRLPGTRSLATELGVSVINISLNLKDDPRIVDAVRDATRRGIAVVLAAGNDGADHPGNLGMAKAGFPNTVLVGALDAAGQPWKGTNRPEAGDPGYRYVWQRGVEVPTELADGSQVVATGTSFAAPIETARLLTLVKPT